MSRKEPDVNRFDARLAAIYTQREDRQQHYDEWAANYDADLVDDLGYVAHRDASDIFAGRVTDRNCRVLDVACGTGLVGDHLARHGYRHIDGVDFSREMLARAMQRGCYQSLWQHDFTTPADPDPPYDALICVGLFSFAPPKISALHHVIGCVKPDGTCVITVNGAAWRELKLEDEVQREAVKHGFTVEDIVEADYIRKEGIDARVLVIRR